MFVISNFLVALANLIVIIVDLYTWIIIARAVVSWVRVDAYHPVVRFIYQVTEPVLGRIRKVLPPFSGLDLSPMVLIFALIFLKSWLVPTFERLANILQ
ncbi:MAG: YggT family protein [Desulfobulbaceae bacterium]|nr:YggT family protein [Desulfobulbaceae bacterium]